jgi:hypothetical protein
VIFPAPIPTLDEIAAHPERANDIPSATAGALLARLAGVQTALLARLLAPAGNDHQAAAVRAQGGVPYTPQEVDLLLESHQVVKPEVWAERLTLIHETKRRFPSAIIPEGAA